MNNTDNDFLNLVYNMQNTIKSVQQQRNAMQKILDLNDKEILAASLTDIPLTQQIQSLKDLKAEAQRGLILCDEKIDSLKKHPNEYVRLVYEVAKNMNEFGV